MIDRAPTVTVLTDPQLWLARELHDPMVRATPQQMGAFVAQLYDPELRVGDPDYLTSALISDALESATFDEEALVERARTFGAEEIALNAIHRVSERAERQAQEVINRVAPTLTNRQKIVVAADLIAREAYDGIRRKSGRPYYEHPRQSALMALSAFTELRNEGYAIDEDLEATIVATALLHDATEKAIRSCKYYDPERLESFSPLMVRHVLQKLGSPHAKTVANTLRLMTHYKHKPWMPDYSDYILRGAGDFLFCLVKPLDTHHNRYIEPKPLPTEPKSREKVLRRNREYERAFEVLGMRASTQAINPADVAWIPRYFELIQNTEAAVIPQLERRFGSYISPTAAAA